MLEVHSKVLFAVGVLDDSLTSRIFSRLLQLSKYHERIAQVRF